MKLIVGLGNPGEEYSKNRHNVGFMILDKLANSTFKKNKKFNAQISEFSQEILLVKPQTFMNNSGQTVNQMINFYKLSATEDLILVYDDIDIPFGEIKLRLQGGSAGHNGVKSVIQSIGTNNFQRLRFGIENEYTDKYESSDFVLSNFSQTEQKKLPALINKSCQALEIALKYDFVSAMNEYNSKFKIQSSKL